MPFISDFKVRKGIAPMASAIDFAIYNFFNFSSKHFSSNKR